MNIPKNSLKTFQSISSAGAKQRGGVRHNAAPHRFIFA
jgi:hypothetical protein